MAGLGDILVEQGVLSSDQLQHAEQQLAEGGGSLAKALVELRYVTENDLVRALAASIGMPFAEVEDGNVDRNAVALLPSDVARELVALPIGFDANDRVVVAIADPNQRQAIAERLQAEIGLPVALGLASRRVLLQAIDAYADAGGEPLPPPKPTLHAVDTPPVAPPATPRHGLFTAPPVDDGDLHEPAVSSVPPAPAAPSAPSAPSAPAAPAAPVDTAGNGHGGSTNGSALGHIEPKLMSEEETSIDLDELLVTLVDRGGSDLHLTIGIPPAIRINGELTHLDDYPRLEPDELRKMLYAIMTQKQRETFENTLELDMSYSMPGKARFRVNVFQQRDALGSVMRVIPFEILPLETLGIPEQVANFAYLPRGFVLVTGPTGSGKSTTLASIIDLVNRNRASHIMTVEDPIEFLHKHKRSVVNQREVGTDTHGFTAALKHVLRQDPDVILVGEMRDLETIQIALTAAETGHLVFGTLHTQDAPQSIDRIIDVFPPHQQEQIRVMLAGALKGVVCQTLVKTANGKGRVPAVELMVATSGIRNLIREGKTHQIYSAIQAGAKDGMVAMDQSLAQLVKSGRITYDAGLEKASQVAEFNRLAGRA